MEERVHFYCCAPKLVQRVRVARALTEIARARLPLKAKRQTVTEQHFQIVEYKLACEYSFVK